MTPGLWSSIQQALDGSDWFVLLASPEAARSPWVNREIEHWVATKPVDRILPVVTDGLWQWDPERHDFSDESSAVPAALRGVFAEEPLFLDLRWARDDLQLNLRHSRFRDAIAQLAAPMHGVSKDDLEGEDVRQHRQARRLWSVAVAALVVLTLVASVTGVFAVRNAQRATDAAVAAARSQQVAAEQRGSAQRYLGEARRQEEVARQQEKLASAATAETVRQEKLAAQQKGLAARASKEAAREQENARRQQGIADAAAARAREQERLAQQQRAAARDAGLETEKQKQIAEQQRRLAEESAVVAREQEQIARQQQRLAQAAAAKARQQEQIAKDQQQLAKDAAAEAHKQRGDAEQQRRVAVGRRLFNKAKAVAAADPRTALRLGVAAQRVQRDVEARSELAGFVASTHFAGTLRIREGDVAFGRDGVLATQQEGGGLALWDVADPTKPTRLATVESVENSYVNGFAFSPDGRTLALSDGHGDTAVTLWDVTDPANPVRTAILNRDVGVHLLAFSPDGRTLVMNDRSDDPDAADTIGSLWDVTDRKQPPRRLATLSGDYNKLTDGFSFSPDGRTLVNTGTIWDVSDRTRPVRLGQLEGGIVASVEFSPTKPLLATMSSDKVYLWDMTDPARPLRSGTGIGFADPVQRDSVSSVAFSPDGRMLASRYGQGRVNVWAVVEDAYPVWLDTLSPDVGEGATLAFSRDSRTLLTTDSYGTATLWNVAAHGAPQPLADLTGHNGLLRAVAGTPDGRSMATADFDGTAMFWDLTTPARPVRRATVSVHDERVDAVGFSRDLRTVAAAGQDGRVTLTDVTKPTRPVPLGRLEERPWVLDESPWIRELVFSPDRRTLAVAVGGTNPRVTLWDLADLTRPTRLAALPGAQTRLAFSPDSRTLAAAHGPRVDVVKLWDLTDRSAPVALSTLPDPRHSVAAVAFSPDGRTMLTQAGDEATLWDVADRARPGPLATLDGYVDRAVFGAGGDTLVTSAVTGQQAAVWDIADRASPVRVARFTLNGSDEHRGGSDSSVVLSSDGRTLAVAGGGRTDPIVMLYDLTKLNELRADPAKQACAVVGRGLNEAEWARYIPEFEYERTCPG